jgi:hypothetical protein
MRHRFNMWIFSTVFGFVISLPFLIPGCSPISDTPAGGVPSEVQQVVDSANTTAMVYGHATTLDDVMLVVKEMHSPSSADGSLPDSGNTALNSGLAGLDKLNRLTQLTGLTGSGETFKYVQAAASVKATSDSHHCAITIDSTGSAVAAC